MRIATFISSLVVLALLGWVDFVFGHDLALFLGLILVWPFVIYFGISSRHPPPGRCEYVYLGIVTLLVFIVTPFLIWKWFDTGLDQEHARYKQFVEIKQLVGSQPRFNNIDIYMSPKRTMCIKGRVESQEDHDSLVKIIEVVLNQDASRYGNGVKVVGAMD